MVIKDYKKINAKTPYLKKEAGGKNINDTIFLEISEQLREISSFPSFLLLNEI